MKARPAEHYPIRSGVGANGDVCQLVADSWIDIATDAMYFLSQRMVDDEGFQQAILACDDIHDLEAIQTAFLRKTIRDYGVEARAAALAMRSHLLGYPIIGVQ